MVPTYQYACTECGEQLEVVQKFTDDPLIQCPSCEGRLRKVFSPVGVVFKGSGFYRTDSRSSVNASAGSKAKDGASAASSGSSDSSSGSGGDSGTATSTSASKPAGSSTKSSTTTSAA